MEHSGMKNPENIRQGCMAITLWILRGVCPERSRRPQNDKHFLNRSIYQTAQVS